MQQLQKETELSPSVTKWLLEEDEPSSQFLTLTELMGQEKDDVSVRRAKERIGKEGWAAKIFAKQKDDTYWENKESAYVPKFTATAWQLAILADLGMTDEDTRFTNAVEHYLDVHNIETGGFSLRPKGDEQFHPPHLQHRQHGPSTRKNRIRQGRSSGKSNRLARLQTIA